MASARRHAQAIERQSDQILDQVPQLQDRTPEWMQLLKLGLIALSLAGAIWLLSATGLWTLVRSAVGWLAALIPAAPSRRRAELDAEALAQGTATPHQRETIAAARASDPTYEAAFKRSRSRSSSSPNSPKPSPSSPSAS